MPTSTNNQSSSPDELLNAFVGRLSARWRFLSVVGVRKLFPNWKLHECMPLANDLSFFASVFVFLLSMTNLGISVFNLSWLVSLPLFVSVFWARKNGKISGTGIFLFWGLCAAVVNVNSSLTFRALLLILTCAVVMIGLRQTRMIRQKFATKPFRLDNINTGSAKILVGRIEVLNVFVESSDSTRRWTPRNRKQSLRESKKALKWLTVQANEFGIKLNFNSQTLFPSGRFESKVPESGDPGHEHDEFRCWINETLSSELTDSRLQTALAEGNIILLVHCNKELRSYAVPHHQFWDPKCQIEYAVISHPPYRQVIAHEILHLFGADDFYPEAYGIVDEDDGERSNLLRGNIMFETSPLLSDLEIDEQTAEKIGWL